MRLCGSISWNGVCVCVCVCVLFAENVFKLIKVHFWLVTFTYIRMHGATIKLAVYDINNKYKIGCVRFSCNCY